jgi:hypothetical protein
VTAHGRVVMMARCLPALQRFADLRHDPGSLYRLVLPILGQLTLHVPFIDDMKLPSVTGIICWHSSQQAAQTHLCSPTSTCPVLDQQVPESWRCRSLPNSWKSLINSVGSSMCTVFGRLVQPSIVEDKVIAASSKATALSGFYAAHGAQIGGALQTIIDNTDLKTVENTVKGFAESSQVLMKALDAVQTIHPFIGGASYMLLNSLARLNNVQ